MIATCRTTSPPRCAIRQQRSLAFILLVWFSLSPLLVFLCGCGTQGGNNSALIDAVAQAEYFHQVQVKLNPPPSISITVHVAQKHLYTFSTANIGLMQPTVDAQDNIWVGEMLANRLGRLNSQTGVVTSWTPPGAQYGIMTTAVDAQGNIWFTEQNANYIGRFEKELQTFHIFPLGTWKGRPLGPQDLHFDGKGLLWFTAEAAGAIGQLDPRNGTIHLWPVPSRSPSIPSSPYSLTITPNGRIWFSEFAGGVIGTLDPPTGQITLYDLPNPQIQLFSLAADATGHIWFTEVLPGMLGMLDPENGTLIELPVPVVSGGPPALYGLAIDHEDTIWFVDVGATTLVRYAPGKHNLIFFRLSLPSSTPFGITLDSAGNLWFTAGGSSASYVGEMTP
jgi:virginiamycin B lyase